MNTPKPARSRSNRSNNNPCQPCRSKTNQCQPARSKTNQSRSKTNQSRSKTNQSRSSPRRNVQAQTEFDYEDDEDDLVFSPLRIGSFLGAVLMTMYGTYGMYASIGTGDNYIKPSVCCFVLIQSSFFLLLTTDFLLFQVKF